MREILVNVIETDKEIIKRLEEENLALQEINGIQDELIDINMMATDEVYTILEPILASMPQAMSLSTKNGKEGRNPMVDLYVAMIQRGLKTIDTVPVRYREQVKNILETLEK